MRLTDTLSAAFIQMPSHYDILIVGSGHSGAQAAIALRQQQFNGSIAIVGEEMELPYERPPLSKDYLAGGRTFDRMLLRAAVFWTERQIDLLLGRAVVAVHPARQTVCLQDGSELAYGKLIWAGGGRPRRLNCPGHSLPGVHYLRSRADADRLRTELPHARRIAVIGGGYIGLEAAAVLVQLGAQVTVLEVLDRVLARVSGEPLSRFYEAEHRAHGVDIRLNTKVERLEADRGRLAGVRLAGGEILAADIAIAGIGIVPAVEPLLAAGAEGSDGVNVDYHCATSLPGIYAIGDCARHTNDFSNGAMIRLESVQNANDQATVAARNIVGLRTEYRATPWFWSHQYDLMLQTVGLSSGHDRLIVRGDPSKRSFSLVYLRNQRIIALDCVNATRDFVQGRAVVEAGSVTASERLSDPAIPLKALLAPA